MDVIRIRQALQFTGARRPSVELMGTLATNVTIAVLSAVGGIMAARLLGPQGRGELAAAVVSATILTVVVSVGLPQALTYHVANDQTRTRPTVVAALFLLVVQSAIGLALGLSLEGLLFRGVSARERGLIGMYLFSIPTSLLTTYLSTVAQGLRRFPLFNALRLMASAALPLAMAVAYATGTTSAMGAVVLLLGSQVILSLLGAALFFRRVRLSGPGDLSQAPRLIRYGLRSYLGNLSWMANARLDQFVMSFTISLASLGQYAVAVSYATILFPISGAFAMVLFPRVAAAHRSDGLGRIKQAAAANLSVSALGAIVLCVAAPLVLPGAFGDSYRPAVLPAIILLAGSVVLGTNYVLSDGLRGLGYPAAASIGEALGAVTTVVGLLALIPTLGIVGAALASFCSYSTVLMVLWWKLRKVTRDALA